MVLLRGDAALRDARRLVARKRLLRRLETKAAALNLRSLQENARGPNEVATRVDSSDFLRIIRDLRRVHSHIEALAYPVLERAAESGDRDTDGQRAPTGTTSAALDDALT
jgi:phosphate:Na+ symporter